jgi:hypothetical protein
MYMYNEIAATDLNYVVLVFIPVFLYAIVSHFVFLAHDICDVMTSKLTIIFVSANWVYYN